MSAPTMREPRHAVPAVDFQGVGRTYGGGRTGLGEVVAVDHADLKIAPGEFVCVLGPSGCGKSTLLNMVAGLDAPSKGRVLFEGAEVKGVNTKVGYMPQESKLFPWLTAEKNIEFPLRARNVPGTERKQLVSAYLAKVGLKGFENAYPHQLSGGMQKRTSLARTLVYRPSLLLMDEPFSALDSQTKMVMHEELLQLWEQEKCTTLFITHDLVEAITLADRVVVMTRRPSRIAEIVDIPLSRPRDVYAIYEQAGFDEIYDHLLRLVKKEMRYE
ncbi:nitrate ABC transporter ATP-binding protein [Mycolicibacterium chitae]|nr:nitrate ABC transporter ATP-binding protein [Mycolicibacterium chitae]